MSDDRKLDILVAEKVLDYEPCKDRPEAWIHAGCEGWPSTLEDIPEFSTSIEAAWLVIENLGDRWTDLSIEKSGLNWTVTTPIASATETKFPLAVCMAALRSVGIEVHSS